MQNQLSRMSTLTGLSEPYGSFSSPSRIVGGYPYTGIADDKVIASTHAKQNVEWCATYREFQDAYTIEPVTATCKTTNTAYPNIVVTQFLTSGLEGTPHHARKSSSHSASSKEQIVTMSAHMRPSQIARVTGISTRTIRQTKELWWKMGAVQRDSTTGMQLIYLPPYSPDFNPIEESFSAIKAWIRANRDYTRSELSDDATPDPYTMIWEAVYMTVTPTKAEGWYRDCGYLA